MLWPSICSIRDDKSFHRSFSQRRRRQTGCSSATSDDVISGSKRRKSRKLDDKLPVWQRPLPQIYDNRLMDDNWTIYKRHVVGANKARWRGPQAGDRPQHSGSQSLWHSLQAIVGRHWRAAWGKATRSWLAGSCGQGTNVLYVTLHVPA